MSFDLAKLDTTIASLTELAGAVLATDGTVSVDGDGVARINDARDAFAPVIGQFIAAAEVFGTPTVSYKNVDMTTTQLAQKIQQLVVLGCMSGSEMSLAAGILQSVRPAFEAL